MSITQQTAETGATMTLKAAPPLAVVGANVAGWPVPEIVQWVTLAYVVLMPLAPIEQMYVGLGIPQAEALKLMES